MHTLLIILPILFAGIILVNKTATKNLVAIFFVAVLALASLVSYFSFESPYVADLPHFSHSLFIFVDIVLLLYFLVQGIVKTHSVVTLLSLAQLVLYGVLLSLSQTISSSDILIDKLSIMMYLIINMVGGIIIIYSLKYIQSEELSEFKKRSFIALEFFFLAVMNFLVSTNNIEIFFMLFEFTTLCSYLLIGYRSDAIATSNALKALWMNQIGGVVILLALILSSLHYDTIHFDLLIANIEDIYLIPIALLGVAAFVKGASIPFESWLLGAMVAPTPVSAMLHSATMVKIAPFLMLKLAPAMSEFVSLSITLFGTFVFFTASLMALSKDYFKEILGLSTIALLALMMAMASIGTAEAIEACLVLMVFHAISKALLFLQAGILEKSFHLKYMKDIDGLIDKSPLVVFFIVIGFASLTLPPFGAFIAKFMAIESISELIALNPLYAISLLFIALGSVFLTLLYFKVLTKLFAKDIDTKESSKIIISKYYSYTSFALVALLVLGIFVSYKMQLLNSFEIFIPTLLILTTLILFASTFFKKAHRVKEYYCGEKERLSVNMYYFNIPESFIKTVHLVSVLFLIVLVLGVLL